jgi:hypothetical protein
MPISIRMPIVAGSDSASPETQQQAERAADRQRQRGHDRQRLREVVEQQHEHAVDQQHAGDHGDAEVVEQLVHPLRVAVLDPLHVEGSS